jgi:hypothetical protein
MPKPRVVRHAVTQPSDPSYRLIALTQGQNAIVDTADFKWLNQWKWFARWSKFTKSFYAIRNRSRTEIGTPTVYMAREILNCKSGEKADHKDRNTLNHRRNNLRIATSSQNKTNQGIYSNNTSGLKGISWHKQCGMWRVDISWKGKRYYLGLFSSRKKGSKARDEMAKKLHGEFASLNLQE